MGRKNRRLRNKELGPDVIKRILADNPSERHHPATHTGMNIEHLMVCEHFIPPQPTESDKACARAGMVCDRIIAELDLELRSDHHVRSR